MNRFLFALFVLVAGAAAADTLVYRQTSQGKTTQQTGTVTVAEENGLTWTTTTLKDSTTRAARTAAGSMVAVEVDGTDGRWALKADGDTLKASGTVKGKPISGSLNLQGRVWAVGFDQPLRWSVARKMTGPLTFLMINPTDVSKPQEMLLTPDGKDTVEGKPALRFKLGLPGALAMFWSATVWADPQTGEQVQYKGNQGPGTADMVLVIDRQP